MWLLTNETEFEAERTWTRDERGAEFWLVAVRAAFEIDAEGRQHIAKNQTKVQRVPEFSGDPLETGLVTDSDFVLHKDGTDILIEGSALAARGDAKVDVRLKVADVDKKVTVWGPRRMYKGAGGVALTDPAPFKEMPLIWENTYGGWDREGDKEAWEPANPVGVGFATDPERLYDCQAPSVEYPDATYRGPGAGRPAGFGPVAHHWQPRVSYAGTYGKRWEETRDPLVPEDFDRRYFRSAPQDQQTAEPLVGYEEVKIGGMSEGGFLGFVLPRIKFDFVTQFKRGQDVHQEPKIHTVWLYPNKRRFEVVYQTALEVPPLREEKLHNTTVRVHKRIGTPKSVLDTGVWSGA
jgi:hypothetical protein